MMTGWNCESRKGQICFQCWNRVAVNKGVPFPIERLTQEQEAIRRSLHLRRHRSIGLIQTRDVDLRMRGRR